MIKRRLKLYIGSFLLIIMSMGLTISTLHSHHHFEWDHPEEFADTGHCISKDTTVCPIVGYTYETEVLSASQSGDIFFSAKETITEKDYQIDEASTFVNRGRSPPALI